MSWAKLASDSIRQMWIYHPHLARAEADLKTAFWTAEPGEIIALVGPSRAGKSALMKRVSNKMLENLHSSLAGTRPIVSFELENDNQNATVDGKSLMLQALEAMEHPVFGINRPGDDYGLARAKLLNRTPEKVLRSTLRSALQICQTKYLIIDESQSFAYTYGGLRTAAALLNSLKVLVQKKSTVLVLVGAYPMLEALNLTPHLIGRKLQLHFPRYRPWIEQDIIHFEVILAEYSKHLKFDGKTSLRDWNELLLKGSMGCVGLLRAWIRDAVNIAWVEESEFLTKRHFEESIKFDPELDSISEEIRMGEELLTRSRHTKKTSAAAIKQDPSSSDTSSAKSKPFTRKPGRDPVGKNKTTVVV